MVSNHRVRLSDVINEHKRMLPPISGFENCRLVSLEESVLPLVSIVHEVDKMVVSIKKYCTDPKDSLTEDESGSIMLYSMEWAEPNKSLYFILNKTLRSENRQLIKPWFLYLRLFIHALSKLPSTSSSRILYRGIKSNIGDQYNKDDIFVWWAFSSCTYSVSVLENEQFFGKQGKRTLFAIQSKNGKDIHNHSMFPTEDEVLLIAPTRLKVVDKLDAGSQLTIVQLEEVDIETSIVKNSSATPSLTTFEPKSAHNKELEDIINQCPSNSDIILNRKNLYDRDMQIVVERAIKNKKCRKLSLEFNHLTDDGALTISDGLKDNPTLEELILYHNQIGSDGVKYISNAISTKDSNLKILALGANNITDNGVLYIVEILKKNRSLITLGLVNNKITDQGVRLLAEVIANDNKYLEILYISKNKSITDSSVTHFVSMFKKNHTLRELWIQDCSLSDTGKRNLRQNTNLKQNFRLEL